MNGIDYFERGWRRDPAAPCMIHAVTGEVHSYERVRETTLRVAATLQRRGFGTGSRAAVLSGNDPLAYAAVLGILRAGLVWLPINARNGVAENAAVLAAFGCEVLFFSSGFAGDIAAIAARAAGVREFVCIEGPAAGHPGLHEWLQGHGSSPAEPAHDPARLFALHPTGGTTGFPKGVMLANHCVEYVVASLLAVAPCAAPPVFLAVAPLTHAAGMTFQYVLVQGGCGIVFPAVDRRAILEAIPRYRVSHVFLPPTLIYDLLAEPGVRGHDYASLRCFFYGAAPMAPDKLREAIEVFGPVMCQVYGQAETGFPNTCLLPAEHMHGSEPASIERLSSCGRATPLTRVEIMDDDGRILPDGAVGEIVVRGLGVMQGYLDDPAATAEASRHGWHHTGDIGRRDADGFFYIVDRKKDMIVSGGFNVYSNEVERAILAHPEVLDCAVVGVPDARWGEAVKAVVQLRPGAALDAGQLIASCKRRIGSMKAPKSVDFVESLPRSATGKVLKREIKLRYWGSRSRMVS